ncbi:MAG TPA: alpha/beta hydrolase [Actinomycetota bacterium]|nr:alpha/beta hydrolase [Actinomycetota bacterium]
MTSIQETLSHRWTVRAEPFSVRTADGLAIAGTRLGDPDRSRPALVMAHGLMGWHRKPRFATFAERMTPWFAPYPFDLRGHGRSEGASDFGRDEIYDVDAVARRAREDGHDLVLTLGMSLGAISVLRHAGILGGTDGVASISSLAYWDWHEGAQPIARRRMQARIGTRGGRRALRLWGVRITDAWEPPESPEDVIGKIAPAPVVLVHGTDDHLFPPVHAERLYEAANDPRRLLLGTGFGHAEDGLSPAFAERLAGTLYAELGLPWSG